MQKTVGRSEQQKEEEKDMAEDYRNQAIGVFELESECICFVALDAAAKAAAVKIQGVERNRLAAGACVKMLSERYVSTDGLRPVV